MGFRKKNTPSSGDERVFAKKTPRHQVMKGLSQKKRPVIR
jgi:hypothetical protein